MKAWLKGGLILVGIAIIVFVMLSLSGLTSCSFNEVGDACGLYYDYSDVVLFPGIFIGITVFGIQYEVTIFALFSAIIYFILGAVIGLIVGKLKSKKEVVKK